VTKLFAVPMSLKEANDFVTSYHRHSGRTARDGGKWAIGVSDGDSLLGVAIVGNPLSATYMDGYTAEVLRVCVKPDSQRGACSFLYARCWQIWQAMGGQRLVTYTLESESGASLKGAGWKFKDFVKPHGNWAAKSRMDGKARQWLAIYGQLKLRWEKASE
jgi:hypothetical protein